MARQLAEAPLAGGKILRQHLVESAARRLATRQEREEAVVVSDREQLGELGVYIARLVAEQVRELAPNLVCDIADCRLRNRCSLQAHATTWAEAA